MPWWRTPMFSSGRSPANGSPQIDRCGLPYIGASVTSGRIVAAVGRRRATRPVTYALRRATGCVGIDARGSSDRACAPRRRDSSASTRRYGIGEPRQRLRAAPAAAARRSLRSDSIASALARRSPAARRSSSVNSGSGATAGSRRASSHCARHCDELLRQRQVGARRPLVGRRRSAAARAAASPARRRAVDDELEPQHLVAARDPEQPVDACPRSAGGCASSRRPSSSARRSSSSPSVTIGWRRR